MTDGITDAGKPLRPGQYDPGDPTSWDVFASSGLVIGLDIGQFQDHSALVWAVPGHRPKMRSA